MKTPYGFECKFFYGNYFRGKNDEECRLLNLSSGHGGWTSKLCKDCPAPKIQRANGCDFLQYQGKIAGGFLGLSPHIEVSNYCIKTNVVVNNAYIGCKDCHHIPTFKISEEDTKI
jgi:hypothetical protein